MPPVCMGDALHDRESQASAATGPRDITAGEAVEGPPRQLRRKPGTRIGDRELGPAVEPPRRLVQTMTALWSEDVQREGTSRVTWEIEP